MINLRLITSRKDIYIPVGLLLFIATSSILIPYLSPYSSDIVGAVHFEIGPQPPSFKHWFGTDIAGRDMFTLTLAAGATSLKVAAGVVFISMTIGVPLGLIAGVKGGLSDDIIMRISDGFLAFPPLILPVAITAALGPSLNNIIIGIAISWFPWYVRISRSQAMLISTMDYVLISRCLGGSNFHIIIKHILPNILSPIIIQASIDAGYAILVSAGLSFIGLGVQHPQVEWGLLITQSRAQFLNYWWVVLFPGLFISMTVVSFNLIGDGIRDYTRAVKFN